MMKMTWKRVFLGAALIAVFPSAITAQRWDDERWDDNRWEELGERIASAVERVSWRMDGVFDHDSEFSVEMADLGLRFERLGERWGARLADDLADALREIEDIDWNESDWSGMRSWGDDRGLDDDDRGPRVYAADFEWSGSIGAGETLEIKGVIGEISAVPASGNQIEVVARKSARRSNPDEVTIEVIEHSGGVTLCALYPTPESARRDNECGVGSDGRMSVNRNDTQVEWEVRVPANVLFHAKTVNGDISIAQVAADVIANTVNGDIELETTGSARAETVNGDVRASFDVMRDDVEFETVNGSVVLDVADDINADLDARWVNGGLESDIPLRLNGRMGRTQAQGMLGDGGPELRVRTVNGSIRIR